MILINALEILFGVEILAIESFVLLLGKLCVSLLMSEI